MWYCFPAKNNHEYVYFKNRWTTELWKGVQVIYDVFSKEVWARLPEIHQSGLAEITEHQLDSALHIESDDNDLGYGGINGSSKYFTQFSLDTL